MQLGHPCAQTTRGESCFTFGEAAQNMVAIGAARFVSREEMLSLLDEADRDGLVLQPENVQDPLFACCCCGCCCGVLTTAKRLPEPASYFNTNYYAVVDAALCEACGTCLRRVLDGVPDHRDSVQTDAEKAGNAFMTICCSRAKTDGLVLDL